MIWDLGGSRRVQNTPTMHTPTTPDSCQHSKVSVVWEGPLGDVRLLIGEVMERMVITPLVDLVVLVDVSFVE